jgi:AraC-like DNA-binding protein
LAKKNSNVAYQGYAICSYSEDRFFVQSHNTTTSFVSASSRLAKTAIRKQSQRMHDCMEKRGIFAGGSLPMLSSSTFFRALSSTFWDLTGYDLDLVEWNGSRVRSCFNCVRSNQCQQLLEKSDTRDQCVAFLSASVARAYSSQRPVTARCHQDFTNTVMPFDQKGGSHYFLLIGRRKAAENIEVALRFLETLAPVIRDRSIGGMSVAKVALSPMAMRVRDYIDLNYREPLQLSDVATVCGVSLHYLSHRFSSEIGIPVIGYLRQLRVERACQQLLDYPQKSVAEICFEVGFQSVSQFNRVFRGLTGFSPKEYRKRC